jgi:hypothetical protein
VRCDIRCAAVVEEDDNVGHLGHVERREEPVVGQRVAVAAKPSVNVSATAFGTMCPPRIATTSPFASGNAKGRIRARCSAHGAQGER